MFKDTFFHGKKFVIILTDQISSRNLAYASALIGFQFGRKVPEMVGRDQNIPSGVDGLTSRVHLGITTRNLPVLNGFGYDNMRALCEKLTAEQDLLVTYVTDQAATSPTYHRYAEEVGTHIETITDYWAIGAFGDEATINKLTQGLRLYGKQPKIPNLDTTTLEKRLIGTEEDLPTIKLILANNLSGGELANAATILGVTYGKLYGDSIFGPDVQENARLSLGLPMIDIAILNGYSTDNPTMKELREKLHSESALTVVDVTDATKTRSYQDYLAIAENTPVLKTTYRGVGISGPSELVAKYTNNLNHYMTPNEEKALLKDKKLAAQSDLNPHLQIHLARKGLSDKGLSKMFMKAALPKNTNWNFGAGIDNEDNFLDAYAQTCNLFAYNNNFETVKHLRTTCSNYIRRFDKQFPDNNWVKEALAKDKEDYQHYLENVQYIHGEKESCIPSKLHIEGRIIADTLDHLIHIIMFEEKGNELESSIQPLHLLVTEEGVKQIDESEVDYKPKECNSRGPFWHHMACYNNHFVPMFRDLSIKLEQKTKQFNEYYREDKIQQLIRKANKILDVNKKFVTLIFSDIALAQQYQAEFQNQIRDNSVDKQSLEIIEIRDEGNNITYQFNLLKDEYNLLMKDTKAFEKLTPATPLFFKKDTKNKKSEDFSNNNNNTEELGLASNYSENKIL